MLVLKSQIYDDLNDTVLDKFSVFYLIKLIKYLENEKNTKIMLKYFVIIAWVSRG